MARPDNYWLSRLKSDRRLAERAQAEVEAEVRRALRSQYLQVARRLDSLYAEAQSRGTLSRTKLWNYRAYRDLEAELRQYCEAGAVIQIDAITKACDKVFRDVIGVDVGSVDRGKFILPYSPRAVIDTAWSGESFSTRVWGNTEELARRIRGEAQEMVMGLKSPATVKQQLMKDYDVSFRQASRLVDTELSYVLNKANLEEYRRRGRKKLTITNLDVNTCDKCKALEGEVFFTEDVPVLPIHPRCHCAYCVPDDLDAAEVTASGEDLDAVYARHERPEGTKGVRSEGLAARSPLPAAGRGNGAVGVKGYGEDAPKQYVPKQQRAAEVARANGLIPASELQAKVEKAMAQTAPELAEKGTVENASLRMSSESGIIDIEAHDSRTAKGINGAGEYLHARTQEIQQLETADDVRKFFGHVDEEGNIISPIDADTFSRLPMDVQREAAEGMMWAMTVLKLDRLPSKIATRRMAKGTKGEYIDGAREVYFREGIQAEDAFTTGAHEVTHMMVDDSGLDPEEIVKAARKKLKLRANSKAYFNMAYSVSGGRADDPHEILAGSVEYSSVGSGNNLSKAVFEMLTKGRGVK